MSTVDDALKTLVAEAAGIVAASHKKVGIRQAMALVGFSEEERQKGAIYQRVRRKAMTLEVVEQGTPPTNEVAVDATASQVSALSSDEAGNRRSRSAVSTGSIRRVRRRIMNEDGEEPNTSPATTNCSSNQAPSSSSGAEGSTSTLSSVSTSKKQRRSPKEVQRANAMVIAQTQKDKEAMKQATVLIKRNNDLPMNDPNRLTMVDIVASVNNRTGVNINVKTASRYVRNGMINCSPLKRGPTGHLPKRIYTALKGAFTTYLKLEQSESKKQSTIKEMSKLVNSCVNKGGFMKTRDDLARKLKKDTADQFQLGKANVQEQRRIAWTTHYNLDVWFSTWKETLVELGFARERLDGEDGDGEVVFLPGQLSRIINLDETDGSLDDTKHQRGGRPAMTFHSTDVAGGATSVNKSGYSCTVICGSSAAGEPLPPHFQLKTTAQTADKEKISIDWFTHSKDVLAKFGHPEKKDLPCTFGMNERGGMNAEELDKYMRGSILPLFPDLEDKPGKRIVVKIDSGPGRRNVEMLASLKLLGAYLVPGVPNTTGKTQETDQNYGVYKSSFRQNLRVLSQSRFDANMTLQVADLPLLVFGGKCRRTGVVLRDSFTDAFSMEQNLDCWQKCGAAPLTRAPLLTNEIRHDVPTGAAAQRVGQQPVHHAVQQLESLEQMNKFYCEILSTNGYDGSKLRKDAPKRETFVAVTKPHSKERIQAIYKAKTSGQHFYVTGGRHINTAEFFQADTLKSREAELKVMEDKKKERMAYIKVQKQAVLMIRKKGDLTFLNEKQFTLAEVKILLKWKKVKTKSTKKEELVEAYITAPKPKIQKSWCNSEEEALQSLKNPQMELKHTALGAAALQMARAVSNNLATLPSPERAALRQSLLDYDGGRIKDDDDAGPNVI